MNKKNKGELFGGRVVQCTDINETTQPEFQSDHTKIFKSYKKE